MDSSESADQLLTCVELQLNYEDIPFELIRKDPGVITALRILVTRAFLDRNYQKRDTQHSIDSLVIAIVARLLKPVQAGEIPTGSSEPVPQPESAKKPAKTECPPEIIDLISVVGHS